MTDINDERTRMRVGRQGRVPTMGTTELFPTQFHRNARAEAMKDVPLLFCSRHGRTCFRGHLRFCAHEWPCGVPTKGAETSETWTSSASLETCPYMLTVLRET